MTSNLSRMQTRMNDQALVKGRIDLDKLPEQVRSLAYDFFRQYKRDDQLTKSEILRLIYTRSELLDVSRLPQTTLALAVGVSGSLLSQVKQAVASEADPDVEKKTGRPLLLPEASLSRLATWIKEEVENKRFPTLRDLKHEIMLEMESINPKCVPSQSWFHVTIKRVLGEAFVVKYAEPLEEERYDVSPDVIEAFLKGLNDERLREANPNLWYNIDETGFGMSKSGRLKRQKVVVPREMTRVPVYKEKKETHFVSAIACISLRGKVLPPGLITKRGTDHPDASTRSFYAKCRRYTSDRAFVTRTIFEDYIKNVLLLDIEQYRSAHPDESKSAVLLMDGHTSHKSLSLRAFCGMNDITVLVIPPHSSHLLQPLDRGFFRRCKAQFSSFPAEEGASRITNTLERIFEAFQACRVTGFIWRCWSHAGIVPVVRDGKLTGYTPAVDKVMQEPALNHQVVESAQGRRTVNASFGILNEDEHLLYEAGQCPFCCSKLDG